MSTATRLISVFQPRSIIGGAALGLVLIATLATSALADNHKGSGRGHGQPVGHDRNWSEHEVRARHEWRGAQYGPAPGAVYAPPVVYAPPPEYLTPGFNLIIPLHIH